MRLHVQERTFLGSLPKEVREELKGLCGRHVAPQTNSTSSTTATPSTTAESTTAAATTTTTEAETAQVIIFIIYKTSKVTAFQCENN